MVDARRVRKRNSPSVNIIFPHMAKISYLPSQKSWLCYDVRLGYDIILGKIRIALLVIFTQVIIIIISCKQPKFMAG